MSQAGGEPDSSKNSKKSGLPPANCPILRITRRMPIGGADHNPQTLNRSLTLCDIHCLDGGQIKSTGALQESATCTRPRFASRRGSTNNAAENKKKLPEHLEQSPAKLWGNSESIWAGLSRHSTTRCRRRQHSARHRRLIYTGDLTNMGWEHGGWEVANVGPMSTHVIGVFSRFRQNWAEVGRHPRYSLSKDSHTLCRLARIKRTLGERGRIRRIRQAVARK